MSQIFNLLMYVYVSGIEPERVKSDNDGLTVFLLIGIIMLLFSALYLVSKSEPY